MRDKAKCNVIECYACYGLRCKILNEAPEEPMCPFFKTDKALYKDRKKAEERLQEIGRKDLIDKFIGDGSGFKI